MTTAYHAKGRPRAEQGIQAKALMSGSNSTLKQVGHAVKLQAQNTFLVKSILLWKSYAFENYDLHRKVFA
jgi:hypothetical protein